EALKGARTVDSFVAIEKPHQSFTIYYRGGHATYRYGEREWDRSDKSPGLELDTSWVNLGDTIGYLTVSLSPESTRMVLPKPRIRGALSLHHAATPRDKVRFMTVVFENQIDSHTRSMHA